MDERRDLVDRTELRRKLHANRSAYDQWSFHNAIHLLDAMPSVLRVPGIADALARDAKVAEIVADFPYGATDSQMVAMAEEVLDAHRWTAP